MTSSFSADLFLKFDISFHSILFFILIILLVNVFLLFCDRMSVILLFRCVNFIYCGSASNTSISSQFLFL
jgi:hypothetical protein